VSAGPYVRKGSTMDHLQYLLLLAGCAAVTLPLELSGSRVYRRPGRLARAVLPVAVVFAVWDVIAIAAGVWSYNPRYVTGLVLPFSLPLEEALFFLVIPVCAVLTFETARRLSLVRRAAPERSAR
jgi:lycopene cyclase domain-containing protein